MILVILIISALTFNIFAYVPTLSWFSIVAFTLSISSWVLSRKIYKLDNRDKNAKIVMILSIFSTFWGLVGILFTFVIGGLFLNGMPGFMSY